MSDQIKLFIFIATIVALTLLLACCIISIIYQYHKKQFTMQKGIQEMDERHQKSILESQLEMQEKTFQKISTEIHDNILLTLSLSKLHLNTLNYSDSAEPPEKINLSILLIGKAIEDLNNISKSLNSDIITNNGLVKAVENQVSDLVKTGQYKVNFEIRGSPVSYGCNNELILFRIIQECLNNILKHARATVINLTLSFSSTALDVIVEDNGIGFVVPESIHFTTKAGINNIKKRAKLLNASLSIRSEPGKGTLIRISVPTINI